MIEERTKKSLRAVKIGIAGNVVLAIFKMVLGILAGSIALISDGVDTIMDVAKSILVFQGIKIAAMPPDRDHPYGHGRAETVVSNIVGTSVIFAGIMIFWETLSNFGQTSAVGSIMIVASIVSIFGKIVLSAYMFKVGKRYDNQALTADAKDYFSDVFASVAVLLGGLFIYLTGNEIFDGISSIVVSGLIAFMGYDILKSGIPEVMEKQDAPDITAKIEQLARETPKAVNPHNVRIRKLGHYYLVDMHLELPGGMTLDESHRIATDLEHAIKNEFPQIRDVIVHTEPVGNGADDEWIRK